MSNKGKSQAPESKETEMQRLECLGENIARAIGGATGQAILKSGQAGTIAKRIEERSKAEEAYMLENPEGCRKCLGTGILSETPEVILWEKFPIRTYCHCKDGVARSSQDSELTSAIEERRRMKNRADKRAEKQPVYDKVSSYFSTAFGSKYYRNGECVVEIGAKFLAGETHATVRSKKNMELALNMVVDWAEKYMSEMGGLNLYIYGDSGVGKTHNSIATFHKIRKTKPLVTTMYILFDEYLDFLKEWFDKKGEFKGASGINSKFSALYSNPKLSMRVEQFLYECDVLFVDEIFATLGRTSEYYTTKLKALLDRRNSDCKVTVFISNKSMGEARSLMSASFHTNQGEETRIFNRMRENGHIVFSEESLQNPDKYGVHVVGSPLNAPVATVITYEDEWAVATVAPTASGDKENPSSNNFSKLLQKHKWGQ